MRMLSYVFETSLTFSEPVRNHSFVLRCLPKSTNTQKVMESQLLTYPRIALTEQVDGFGNRIVSGYCPEAHDEFGFYATGVAMVEPDDAGPTPAHPMYAQFTALTAPDDALRKAVRGSIAVLGLDGGGAATGAGGAGGLDANAAPFKGKAALELVQCLCDAVYTAFDYEPGTTDTTTTAAQAFAQGKGVCQDYAHVLVTLCRVAGIPARYVTGLMVGEGVTHAWVEVHDGTRWHGFDPTHNCAVDDRYLLFATGRDFEDCPIERGVFRGNAEQRQKVSASLGDDVPAVNAARAFLPQDDQQDA